MAKRLSTISLLAVTLLFGACAQEAFVWDPNNMPGYGNNGKADGPEDGRIWTVLLTRPHCDICTANDKSFLKANSPITAKIVQLIDNARNEIDVAQFTFSVREIEQALIRAHQRGISIRIAMNGQQELDHSNVAHRLLDAGLDVRFVNGRDVPNSGYSGLMHAKFMMVDGSFLAMGSNNWSSTGTSINEENTLVVEASDGDSMLKAFACHFKAIWSSNPDASGRCATDEVAFTPSSKALGMLKQGIRDATQSVDVLMHHFLFTDLVKELAKAAERGVQVRVIINQADQGELTGSQWNRFDQAGGQLRFKKGNADMYQLMHHKLAIVDGEVLYNGSGNWSGSAFFNNYEFYIRISRRHVVTEFNTLFARLWMWSLSAQSMEWGKDAAQQHAQETQVFFGNLHAHFESAEPGQLLDDGKLERVDEHGHPVDVSYEMAHGDAARYAFEYARDQGQLDFLALTPHCADDAGGQADNPNMNPGGYQHLLALADQVNDMSSGMFLAIPGMEWNTNSAGNHVTILGSKELAKVLRGRFDLLYESFLPERASAGDRVFLGLNHPRTFRRHTETLKGNWDQVFGVSLLDIPNNSQRKNKFNDFGIDDYPPLNAVHGRWVAGQENPDNSVVFQALQNVRAASQPYARFMEVTVGRGKELNSEVPSNPSLMEREDGSIERFTRVHHDWDYYLLNGFELAPSAPHDNHFANWGRGHTSRTAIVAKSLREEHIFGAIDQRAMYATEDQNTEIRVYADGRVPMGSSMAVTEQGITLSVLIRDPDSAQFYDVKLYQGSVGGSEVRVTQSVSINSDQWSEIDVDLGSSGRHFVYLEILATNQNRMSWSAPIWIDVLGQ